jgi:Uma2 family endonuclease
MPTKETTAEYGLDNRLKMSYEEFLDWADEDKHAEWVNGEVIVFMPVKEIHQITLQFLYRLLSLYIDLSRLGKILTAPYSMRATAGGSSREPDILFVAREHLERIKPDRLDGPADLIIEIVSDDSVTRDRDEKYREYAAAGVPEYWVIDPRLQKQRADFFCLDDTGMYRLLATEDDERFESKVLPGFWLKPAWIWEANERDPLSTFGEMANLPEQVIRQFKQQLQAGLKKNQEAKSNP